MRRGHLHLLLCPECRSRLEAAPTREEGDRILHGTLVCAGCGRRYPIVDSIPRFVSPRNYAAGFGYQWNRHDRTQFDATSGLRISEERFFNETRWPRSLPGQAILEAGCGSGRFTEHAASTGATVVSFDYSRAVDANYRSNGRLDNVLIVQADVYRMPFPPGSFDKAFCIGVIQHTPMPEKAVRRLAATLTPGGELVIDVYEKLPWWKRMFESKYWVRPLTRRMPSPLLYKCCAAWVRLWWPFTGWLVKLTGRRALSWFLLVADYRGVYPLPDDVQKEWSILDTFDMLAPAYDFPQTIPDVRRWLGRAGFEAIEVGRGYNGIEGRGRKGGGGTK